MRKRTTEERKKSSYYYGPSPLIGLFAARAKKFKVAQDAVNDRLNAPAPAVTDARALFLIMSISPIRKTAFLEALGSPPADEVVTNAEGKYQLKHIAVGSWYVYAVMDTELLLVEWLVPVTITKTDDITLDLFNDNAVTVSNRER